MNAVAASASRRVVRTVRGQPTSDGAGVKLTRVIGQRELNEAYSHLRARDDRAAMAAFQRGFATGEGTWTHYADAAYAAKRLGDNPSGSGVGLGLAVARGFVEAMGGQLLVDDTPGGGCTMVVSLPVVAP